MKKSKWMCIFADNLRDLMEENAYGVKELADEIGISAGTISRYLNYQRMPTIENLLKLKYTFNCGWDDLLDFDEPIDD